MSKYDSEASTTITAICALSVTLLTSALLPVDIFIVSFMKYPNGTFKDWANDSATRESVENTVAIGYYTLYGMVTFFLFIALPFVYFYYEEKDFDSPVPIKSRICTALKYTIVFVIIVAVLLVVGAVVPGAQTPSANETEWKKFESLFTGLASNGGEDAISFVISSLSLIGMLALMTFTAYGMSALPLDLVRGKRHTKQELVDITSRRDEARSNIDAIKVKYSDGKRFSSRDRKRLTDLEESENLLTRQQRHLDEKDKSYLHKCSFLLRPLEVATGIVLFLMALLIFISLLLTNVDKAMHSILGYKLGYAISETTLPNPIDIVLVLAQRVFPLDYILVTLIMVYFVFCSISGIRNIGIWFFCVKLYKIRPRRTSPQALLMMCMIMMYIVLAINILMYELTPQYSTFGSEHFMNMTSSTPAGNETKLTPCALTAPAGTCVMTQMAHLLMRFFYKMWFFGAAYYWATWIFLAVYLLGFLVAVIKRRKSTIEGEVDEDDIDESDDELIPA